MSTTTPLPPTERAIRALPLYEIVRHDSDTGPREYSTPAGRVPSVTSILDRTKDRRALDEWRESIGSKRADAIRDLACARGTAMHHAIEHYLQTHQPPAFSYLVTPYWKSISHILPEIDSTLLMEAPVWHEDGYAGSVDWLGYFKDSGPQPELADWKSADKPANAQKIYTYSLQLAAYVAALNYVYRPQGLNITRARLYIAMPCRAPQVEIFEADALKQLFRHFQARLQRFTFPR